MSNQASKESDAWIPSRQVRFRLIYKDLKMKLFAVVSLLLVGVGLALGANYSSTSSQAGATKSCACTTCCADGSCCCELGICSCNDCKCDCCDVGSVSCAAGCCSDKAEGKASNSEFKDQGTCPKCPTKSPTSGPK